MRKLNIDTIIHHYLFSALWTSEMESKHAVEDFGYGEQYYTAVEDIGNFLKQAVRFLGPYVEHFGDEAESRLGHDFWLSRNGHGAGFFDHSLGGTEKKLQEIARTFPEKNVFEAETENIFIE